MLTIRQGDTGDPVKIAQYLMGYAERKKAPGIFDASFVAAVCTWQRTHELTPDGVIGPATWAALAAAAPICSKTKNTTSAATCALQLALGGYAPEPQRLRAGSGSAALESEDSRGLVAPDGSVSGATAGLEADGVYGSKTRAAVIAYQAANGLNPDGTCGPITWGLLIGGVSQNAAQLVTGAAGNADHAEGEFVQPVDYKQYDSRWGKKMYSSRGDKSQTMSNSACGPTSMADIVATWVDKSITPYDLAQLALSWGDRTASNGTAWSFFAHVKAHYGFSKMIESTSIATLKACLDAGGYAVCSMGPGYWTKGGHFICAWKYESGYIFCNDPASSSRKRQKEADFVKQRKRFFCFYK